MEFLGIGPLELLIIALIALVLLGPKDMAKAGRSIGKILRKVVTSPNWRVITNMSHEIRTLPNRLIREAGLEEMQQEINGLQKTTSEIKESLQSFSILPPDLTRTITQKPQPTPPVLPDRQPADNSEEKAVISDAAMTAHSQTDNPQKSSSDFSAWISAAGGDDVQSSNDQTDITAWTTSPSPAPNPAPNPAPKTGGSFPIKK